MSRRDPRVIPRINYTELEAGRSPVALNSTSLESGCPVAVDSPSTIVQMPSSQADSDPTDIEAICTALMAA